MTYCCCSVHSTPTTQQPRSSHTVMIYTLAKPSIIKYSTTYPSLLIALRHNFFDTCGTRLDRAHRGVKKSAQVNPVRMRTEPCSFRSIVDKRTENVLMETSHKQLVSILYSMTTGEQNGLKRHTHPFA
ncbi:hypothetical protein AVEN_142976-1 [Araneus ventricosus]|uniref:Uncharacterized protein n=1 Tax=Araneus ventricosus TaxID=182803 RepID=A0A4Y2PPN7_ARAVE|nr:hypothetical protein AVEN_142976-1 [Araneus ventricosus]